MASASSGTETHQPGEHGADDSGVTMRE